MFAKIFSLAILASLVAAAPIAENAEKRANHGGQATYFETGLGACGWVCLVYFYVG